MTAARREQKKASPTLHYLKMLELAEQMGCQMEPNQGDNRMLRGFCPFHQGTNMHNSRTLRMDARTGRFNCEFCQENGTAIGFFAKVWGVNAQDTHTLLGSPDAVITAERPRFPQNPEGRGEGNPDFPWLNSAIMTRAAKYYERQLYVNYPPLRTLAKFGIEPAQAARAGVGYCTGAGLREFLLEETDATPDELENNPLWNRDTGLETLAGRITITDRDHTGAAMWITSILPEDSANGTAWRPERPHNYGITGRKPFLFGQYSANSQSPWAIFTDDPRLYIAAACHGAPAMLMTQYRHPGEDLKSRCRRTAEALHNRRMKSLSIVMHDREAAGLINSFMQTLKRGPEIVMHGRAAIMENLRPHTRDINKLRKPQETGEQPKAKAERKKHPQPEQQTQAQDGAG